MSDWDSTTIIGQKVRAGGGGPRQQVARSQAQINAARRSGLVLSVDKKYGSSNSKGNNEGQRLTMVDRETDIVPVKKLDVSVGKAIARARGEKKLTQKDLATKINEKPTVINDYEAGRAIPNQQILAKLERALGVKLRGKNIGEPLGGPKKKN
ncbi:LAFE_0D06920g1_1 [Lachancea fermentati]|uniref:Multiprotein-bridging factor 1 n=1 Tax=Lachancea fermentati TaxID=4955 RepID=A0A1G4MBL6_LACFM|nr:LAFE_0D06920g1_1 [Lachancea fermentati]